jgi:hypothetical protein
VSNVRSKSLLDAGQEPLWEDAPPGGARPPGSRRAARAVERVLVVAGDEFVARGWPAGTRLHYEPARRAVRGDLVVVEEGGRLRAGVFALQLGRPALRTDLGATWLTSGARVVGLVTMAEAPFDGMPST